MKKWAYLGVIAVLISFKGFQQIVNVKHEPPRTIPSDRDVEGSLTIYKGGLRGYAKLEVEFPAEVNVMELESAGGAFTFSDNTMKIIWISLPPSEVVTVKYKARASKKAQGVARITGKFIYVDEGQRKIVDIPPVDVNLGKGPEEIAKEQEVTPEIKIRREITKISEREYRVDIKMDKKGIIGFARISEELPADVSSQPMEIHNASFAQLGTSVKIVWMNIPEDEHLTVSYVISSDKEIPFGNITGTFSYLYKEDIINVEIPTTKFPEVVVQEYTPKYQYKAEGEAPKPIVESGVEAPKPIVGGEPEWVSKKQTKEEKRVEGKVEVPSQEKKEEAVMGQPPIAKEESKELPPSKPVEEKPPVKPSEVKPEEKVTAEKEKKGPVEVSTSQPAPKKTQNVHYSVQVCALRTTRKSPQLIQKAYNFYEEGLRLEEHEGWFKYILASKFTEYKNARDRREALKKYAFPGPFVTAYLNNKRITVQEALMITGQKWVP